MKYTKSHEWITVEGKVGTVGITHYAQRELGDIVYVELPDIGRLVRKGQEAVVLESTKAAADVYSPVSGKIVKVNRDLQEAPELINSAPESHGWLFQLELSHPEELDSLLTSDAYQQLIHQ